MANSRWVQNLLRVNEQIRLGRDAVTLDDLQRVAKLNRQSVAAGQRKFLGSDMPAPEQDEEDMGVQVGDNYFPQPRGIGPLVGGLIGAGLLAIGGPLAVLAWNSLPKSQSQPVPQVAIPKFTDTDTKYEIRLLP
jgi:hypothetical protein